MKRLQKNKQSSKEVKVDKLLRDEDLEEIANQYMIWECKTKRESNV